MLTTLALMLLAVAAVAFWSAGRAAAEAATLHGRQACESAGVQWLDQSVHLVSMRLRRAGDGWLGLERQYRFEYSSGGEDRHSGLLLMQGRRLVGLVGPMPAAPPG